MGNSWTAQRYEKKYILTNEQYLQLKERLKDITVGDEYGNTTICNIYYDTPDFKLVRKSLSKPIYKEKCRIRSYGVAKDESTIFAEIKKKYKGVVYKRRVGFTYGELNGNHYESVKNTVSKKDKQILKEMSWLFELYDGLAPKMFISYDREALFTTDDSGIRITFDSNILYRTENLRLNHEVSGTPILENGTKILELKTGNAIPLWMANILNELKIYPSSYSKYGTAYKKFSEVKNNESVA